MSFAREAKRRARACIAPAVFLSLVAYFGWNATRGELGLRTYAQRQRDLRSVQAGLDAAQAEQAAWTRRVEALRSTHVDPDELDERARAMLNLAAPNDIVVPIKRDPAVAGRMP